MTSVPPGATRPPTPRALAWVARLTALAAATALLVGITTPPRSGDFCTDDCVGYPYVDAAAFVPRDYLWMYPAVVMVLLFLVLTVCLHEAAAQRARAFSGTAVALAVLAATTLVVDYGIQLTVMQPSLLAGETEGLSPFSQYNPHGVFIALENVGYLAMALAFVFAGLALGPQVHAARAVRWVMVTGGALTVVALVVLSLVYRADLDYRFEVAAISIDWIVLIVTGVLLGRR